MSKYVEFQDLGTFNIITSLSSGDMLGKIEYTKIYNENSFIPEKETVFSRGCLLEILNEFFDLRFSNSVSQAYFEFAETKPRTFVWRVYDKDPRPTLGNGVKHLGKIHYYAPWRQYCLSPTGEAIKPDDLGAICKFLETHAKDRVPK